MAKQPKTFLDDILDTFENKVLNNHTQTVEAISTGSISLNASIGIGGIPKGMITEIYGPEGSGKTTIALNTVKQVANAGGKGLYIDIENLLNPIIIKAILGDDTNIDNIIILTPDSAEDAFIMAEKAINSGEFDIIVIDSIGALASRKEKEIEFDKDTMGVIPRVISKFIRRNVYDIRTKNIAMLIVNQVRDSVGSYVKSFNSPGGHVLKHQAAVRIALSRGEYIKRGTDIVGILVKFVVKKNKLAPPFRSFTLPLVFGEGIDYFDDFIEFAKMIGVLTMGGSYYKFEGDTIGQGKVGVRETLEKDKNLLDKIQEMVYNIVNHDTNVSKIISEIEGEVEDGDSSSAE